MQAVSDSLRGREMTPQELEMHGYRRFSWNNGTIIEYWKSIGIANDDFESRIGVRFGEWKDTSFLVWLFFPHQAVSLRHITTIKQVERLYKLLKAR